jgi:predicted ATPase
VSLLNTNQQTKALGVSLLDGVFVSAAGMSDGLLRWLAFAALPYLTQAALVLVEEPENGLDPASIRDVMSLLRDVSARAQVIIATHSPIVVGELEKHEVTVLRPDPREGTKAVLLSDQALESGTPVRALVTGDQD